VTGNFVRARSRSPLSKPISSVEKLSSLQNITVTPFDENDGYVGYEYLEDETDKPLTLPIIEYLAEDLRNNKKADKQAKKNSRSSLK
jgi:hypothetical protein